MLLKTKLLLSLGTLGVSGGVGVGVYYIKNKKEDNTKKDPGQKQTPNLPGGSPPPIIDALQQSGETKA